MHLTDAFIQSDLHCIQVNVTISTFYQLLLSLGIEHMILALLVPCSTIRATGKLMYLNVCNIVTYAVFTQINSICLAFCPWVFLLNNKCSSFD